jgi:hypothetical protein
MPAGPPDPVLVHVVHADGRPLPRSALYPPHSAMTPGVPAGEAAGQAEASGQAGSQRLSHRLILALRSKPTLARSWERRSYGEELRTAPLETSHNGNLAM